MAMIWQRIKAYTEQEGIDYKTIAAKAQLPLQAVTALLGGKEFMEMEVYARICQALEKPFDFFFEYRKL